MVELKPCPFCGGKAELVYFHTTATVHCMRCMAMTKVYVPTSVNDDVQSEAVTAWNSRATNDELEDHEALLASYIERSREKAQLVRAWGELKRRIADKLKMVNPESWGAHYYTQALNIIKDIEKDMTND